MERNKMIGLVISVLIALSGAAIFVYAPPMPKPIRPGTYSGQAFGKIVSFIDQQWVLVSPPDTNGFSVVGSNGPYVFISPGDVNETIKILSERGIVWYRDAVIEMNGVEIGGQRRDLNVVGFVLPGHNVGDVIPVSWQIVVNADGTYNAVAQEILTP